MTLKTGAEIERRPSDDEPFTALAFKIATDPFVGRLCFFRVYAGHLEAGSYVLNARTENKERVGRIVRMKADDREEVKEVFARRHLRARGPQRNFYRGHFVRCGKTDCYGKNQVCRAGHSYVH